MRISDYKLVLDPIPDNDLDRLVAVRSDTSVRFEPAEFPPERWNHFVGVIVPPPGRTTPENGSPEPTPEITGLDTQPPASEQFLAGFMQDLKNEFGESIAAQCLTHLGLTASTPITARTVKEVIAHAEKASVIRLATLNDAPLKAAIETSPVFSPRQKLLLTEWLGQGRLSLDQIDPLAQLAEWAQGELSVGLLPALNGDRAANALADTLENFANGIGRATAIARKNAGANATDGTSAKDDYPALIHSLCTKHAALAAAGLSIQEAKILLSALDGDTGAIARQIMQNKSQSPYLVARLHDALKDALLQRAAEVDADFYPPMATAPGPEIEAERSEETREAPPKGDAVPKTAGAAKEDASATESARIMAHAVDEAIAQAKRQQKLMRMTNEYNLRTYFDHGMWTGILPLTAPQPQAAPRNDNRYLGEDAVPEVLGEQAVQFVKTLVTAHCKTLPGYALEPLKLAQFVDIAKSVLAVYNEIRTLPMMTPELLELTFFNGHQNVPELGVEATLRELPLHAATLYLVANLDPSVPSAFLSQALRETRQDTKRAEPTEVFLIRTRHEFPVKFEQAKTQSALAGTAPCAEIFEQAVTLGQKTLHTMLEDYFQMQEAIETSPLFSTRQKTMLTQWLDHRSMSLDQIKTWSVEADEVHQELANALSSLTTAYAAKTCVETLEVITEIIEREADAITREQTEQTPKATLDENHQEALKESLCQTYSALAATGLSTSEARKLVFALSGRIGIEVRQRLDASPLQAFTLRVHDTLYESLHQRSSEVSDIFHAQMSRMLDREIKSYREPEDLVPLPCGHSIPERFWEAVRDANLSLHRDDESPFIDPSQWKELDDATRMQRLDTAYTEILTSFFGGNADEAALLLSDVLNIEPAVQSVCTASPTFNPICLPRGPDAHILFKETPHHQKIRLLGKQRGCLEFFSTHAFTEIRGVSDGGDAAIWLVPERSRIEYECHLTLTPKGNFILQKPMHLDLLLTPSDWPKKDYPEPIPRDLYTPHCDVLEDLLEYAFSSGNPSHANVLVALEAVHTFREAPSIEDVLSIHERFMATDALACLGDISAEVRAVTQLHLDLVTFEPTIQALNAISNTLESIIFDPMGRSTLYEDWAIDFRDQIFDFIDHPTFTDFNQMNAQLFDPNGAFSQLKRLIPEDELAQLYEVFDRARTSLHALFFESLENKIVNFIAEEILPGFIASVREESAAKH